MMSKDKDQEVDDDFDPNWTEEAVIVNEESSKYVHIPFHERYDGHVVDYFQTQVQDVNIIGTVMEKPVLRYEKNGLFCTYLYVTTLHQMQMGELHKYENHTTTYTVEIWSNMPGRHDVNAGDYAKALKCEVGAKVYISGFLKAVNQDEEVFGALQAKYFTELAFYGDQPKKIIHRKSLEDRVIDRCDYMARIITPCIKGVTLEEFEEIVWEGEDLGDVDIWNEELDKTRGNALHQSFGYNWEHCHYAKWFQKEVREVEPFSPVPTQPNKPPEGVKKKTLTRQERKKTKQRGAPEKNKKKETQRLNK